MERFGVSLRFDKSINTGRASGKISFYKARRVVVFTWCSCWPSRTPCTPILRPTARKPLPFFFCSSFFTYIETNKTTILFDMFIVDDIISCKMYIRRTCMYRTRRITVEEFYFLRDNIYMCVYIHYESNTVRRIKRYIIFDPFLFTFPMNTLLL